MKFTPDNHHRQSIRLPAFDYRSFGAYFVTICTFDGECMLDDLEIFRDRPPVMAFGNAPDTRP